LLLIKPFDITILLQGLIPYTGPEVSHLEWEARIRSINMDKFLDPDVLSTIWLTVALIFYLLGRITKKQFMVEQLKAKTFLTPGVAKDRMVEMVTRPLTFIFDFLNLVPVIKTKLPLVELSVPSLFKWVVQLPIGFIGDLLHNLPVIGTKVKK
jgi:hypothetical protein